MTRLIRCSAVAGFVLAFSFWSVAQDAPPTPQPALPAMQKKQVAHTAHLALPVQQTTTEIPIEQQPSKEQVAELMDVMEVEDDVSSTMAMLPAMIEQQTHAEIKSYVSKLRGGVSPTATQQAEIEKLTQKYINKAVNIYPVSEMVADLAVLYQHHLNNADVESLIFFFGSDAGQHLLEVRPAIMKEYMPTVTARIDQRDRELNAELKKDLEQIFANARPAAAK